MSPLFYEPGELRATCATRTVKAEQQPVFAAGGAHVGLIASILDQARGNLNII
jgi:hypothetical protein